MQLLPLIVLTIAGSEWIDAATAQAAPSQAFERKSPQLWPYRSTEGETTSLGVRLVDAAGPAFLWMANIVESDADGADREVGPAAWFSLGVFPLDSAGTGDAVLTLPTASLPTGASVQLQAVFLDQGVLTKSPVATLDPDEEPTGEILDLDWGSGGAAQAAGAIISTVQPWSSFMTVTAVNHDASHADAAILFDSGAPTGGDDDLGTPGTGSGNDEAYGQLLIIAADVDDVDGDDHVDIPRSEPSGGTLIFDFPGRTTVGSFELVDADEPGGEVRFYDETGLLYSSPINPGDDNGVQTINGSFGVTRMEVELAGTAGIGEMRINPCLATLDFDNSTTGIPLGLGAGAILDSTSHAYTDLLVYFVAENNRVDHPDLPILFDTNAVTGGDTDLATPGYGPGNTRNLGKVLILAENDVDADGDDLIDVPDDEFAGGTLGLAYYTSDATFRGATVLDIDTDESAYIEVFLSAGGTEIIPLQSLGDNSSQTVTAEVGPTRYIAFHFSGSGAVAEIVVCPQN